MQVWLSFLLVPGDLSASASTIRGRVTGARTGEFLIGAVVVVQGTEYSVPVNPSSSYEIRNVSAGSYTVQASYVGNSGEMKTAVLDVNQTLTVDFALHKQTQNLGGVVTGKLNREEASRRSEKSAQNVINLIAARAIERSPDINVANVLTRVSGVMGQRTAGLMLPFGAWSRARTTRWLTA